MGIIQTKCELCLRDEDISRWELGYLDRTYTAAQCIEELDCKPYTWRMHINTHVKPQVAIELSQRSELTDHIVDKIGEVMQGLEDLKDVMKVMKSGLLTNPDPAMLKTYISSLAELRHYTETLQKLQNEFKDTGKINIQNMNIEYKTMVGRVMQDACPVCKQKFAVSLKDVITKVPNDDN